MGDVGWFDDEGRFCGSAGARPSVETAAGPLYTEQAEPVFNTVPGVRRTALVGVGEAGSQLPVLCYELLPDADAALVEPQARWPQATRSWPASATICVIRVPVDIRHNAKIGREKLVVWAAGLVR